MKTIYFVREKQTQFGGAERYLSRLCAAMDDRKIAYKTIHSIFPLFLPSWLRILLFNCQVWIGKGSRFYFSLERITCPDIYRAGDGVHKVFLEIENKSPLNPLHSVYLFLEKRSFTRAGRIIANSEMVKQEIVANYGVNPGKIKVIYNGIELKKPDYGESYRKLTREFGITENDRILLYVGNGFKRKGVDEFLEIVSRLNDRAIKAFVVGKETNIGRYRSLVHEKGIQERVFFTGSRKDVDDFYTISDVFLLPTHYEPFSNVVLEAMNFGTVVFTTRQNGASEILDQRFVMNSPEDFSVVDKISGLLADPEELNKVKLQNWQRSRCFSMDRNLEATLEVIGQTMGSEFPDPND
jgi:UDP-glucose:(heptosyl)LPS alpha-1,3-glucosyltransferase